MRRTFIAVALLLASPGLARAQAPQKSPGQAAPGAWQAVEEIIGQKGSLQPGEVFKMGLPRYDLVVKRGTVSVHPVLGLGSWIAFKATGSSAFVHGDLCLREEEVNPVMSRLQQGGIETTALHNHLSGEQPRVMFLHFWGQGQPTALAQTLRAALDLTGTPRGAAQPVAGTLDQAALEKILGQAGKLNAGVLQFSIPRPFPIRMHGMELPPAMGMATAINFQPIPQGGTAVTGDFVLREEELAGVLRALRAHGIDVTAVHNHMVNDDPRMVFVHFWGEGPAAELARGLRAALDALESPTPKPSPASRDPRWDFEDGTPGRLPAYVEAARGRWEIRELPDAPAGPKTLVQTGRGSGAYFNLAVIRETSFQNLRLSVRLKALEGSEDQGGGVVWRYQDPQNYYIARWNPLEDNFRVYRVVGGRRVQLESAAVRLSPRAWHTLAVEMRGSTIVCELDGQTYLRASDATFPQAGAVGLWSKADAVTAFDEFRVEPR